MDKPQDVIQFALDNMGREITLILRGVNGRAFERQGRLTGLGTGPVDTITVEEYRAPGMPSIVNRTLVELDEIIDIALTEEGS